MLRGIIIFERDESIRKLLLSVFQDSEEYELTGHYNTCKNIGRIIRTKQPAIVLLDADIESIDVITNIRLLKEASPETAIVILSSVEEEEKILQYIHAGANGYLAKSATPDALHCGIKLVLEGGAPMSESLAMKLFESFQNTKVQNSYELSHQELSILKLLSRGHGCRQLAEELNMAIVSVRVHIKNIYLKMKVTSSKEAIAIAIAENII